MGLNDYNLQDAVQKFIDETKHPAQIRENMDYIRVLANMGAHTKTDTNGEILEATREEAEWTLKVIVDLFEYFIIRPAKDKELREKLNQRLIDAGKPGLLPKKPKP